MKGKYEIQIEYEKINYKLTINRNITIIKDISAKGKSKIIELIRMYRIGIPSINIRSKVEINYIDIDNYEERIKLKNNIFFIDEDCSIIYKNDFADIINKGNDNYFVLITRNPLPQLNYSVNEIYEIEYDKSSNTNYMKNNIKMSNIDYSACNEIFVAEDSKSSYLYFKEIYKNENIDTSNGRHNMNRKISKLEKSKINKIQNRYIIFVDCASFGSNIQRLVEDLLYKKVQYKILNFESFEFLLCKVQEIKDIEDIISNSFNYIDSLKYNSYELFFEDLISEILLSIGEKYNKREISNHFLNDKIKRKIVEELNIFKDNDRIEMAKIDWE